MARPTREELNLKKNRLIAFIREQIRDGVLQPLDFLPSELQLGKQYELSKESVRLALDALVEEGLITKIRRVGNRVNDLRSGAAGKNIDTARTIELRFAYHNTLLHEIPIRSLIESFELTHPNVRINAMPVVFPVEYADHHAADVITLTAWDAMKRWSQPDSLHHLLPMTQGSVAHPKLYEAFRMPAESSGTSDEQPIIAEPFLFSPIVLVFNRSHFMQCGLSEPSKEWTWFTLLRSAITLSNRLNIWGFIAHIQSINRWPVFLLQNGFRFRPEDPAWNAADDPALWESLRVARDLLYNQKRPMSLWTENNSDAEQLFLEGKASMIMTTYYGMNRFLHSAIDYAVAPLPSLAIASTLLTATGLSVVRSTKHEELARQFIDHLVSFDSQALIKRSTVTLPARSDALSITEGLSGNRPAGERIYEQLWEQCGHYADLKLDAHTLDAIRKELKAYWSRLEDEAETSERLGMLFK